jgi:hypothetical protein
MDSLTLQLILMGIVSTLVFIGMQISHKKTIQEAEKKFASVLLGLDVKNKSKNVSYLVEVKKIYGTNEDSTTESVRGIMNGFPEVGQSVVVVSDYTKDRTQSHMLVFKTSVVEDVIFNGGGFLFNTKNSTYKLTVLDRIAE